MIYQLIPAKEEDFTPPPGVEYDARFNHIPKPCKEISRHRYIHSASIWSPRWREYRQVRDLPGMEPNASGFPLAHVRIEWYWFGGLVTLYPSKWHTATDADREADPLVGTGLVWEGEIRYFLIGCEHTYRRMTAEEIKEAGGRHLGQHDNWEVCSKCGLVNHYDSSG